MYWVVFGLLYLLSLLPLWLLYGASNVVSFLLFNVFGYRRKVVEGNLAHAFPEKTARERRQIAQAFYRNFIDNWIETLKLLSISKKQLSKRVTANVQVFQELYQTGKAVQVNLGHFFNWEMMSMHLGLCQPYPVVAVYLPQSSGIFNRLLKHVRSRWGNALVASTQMAKEIMPWRNKQYLLILAADQSPATPDGGYWLPFMNRPTPFARGAEKFTRMLNLPVVMMTTTKPKRGYYHFDFHLVATTPNTLPAGELIRRYVAHLEQNIRLQPAIYLWSHNRWKHTWQPGFQELWVAQQALPAVQPSIP